MTGERHLRRAYSTAGVSDEERFPSRANRTRRSEVDRCRSEWLQLEADLEKKLDDAFSVAVAIVTKRVFLLFVVSPLAAISDVTSRKVT